MAAVGRGLAVLEVLGEGGILGNKEIAERTKLPVATVVRLIGTLLQLGYVSEGPHGRGYQVGARSMSLGYSYLARHDIGEIVQSQLRELADAFPCAVSLVTRDELEMIYLAQARSRSARLMINVSIGSRVPLAVSAGGRAYLAGCSANSREKLFKEIAAADRRAWSAVERGLQAAMKECSEFGFCTAFNVNGSGINGVSTPLTWCGSLYSLTCAGPAILTTVEQMRNIIGPKLVEKKMAIQMGAGLA